MDREAGHAGGLDGAAPGSTTRLTQTVKHSLDLLFAFKAETPTWGVNELARHLGLNKSTVSRLLATLEERRLVRQDPETERYRLGIGLVELAGVVLDGIDLHRVAAPYLRQLSAATRETINLAIWDRLEVVIVEHLPSPEPVKYLGWIGDREPSHAVSPGKAMLAFSPPEVLQAVIEAGLTRYTPNTLTDPDELRRDLELTRRRGYAINRGEFRESLHGVAAPIWQFPGVLAGAVAVAGPAYRLSEERLEEFGRLVKQTACEISRELGGGT